MSGAPTHAQVKDAVAVIKAHLAEEWISEGCQTDAAFGCASCQAVRLAADLDALVSWLDDDHVPASSAKEGGTQP